MLCRSLAHSKEKRGGGGGRRGVGGKGKRKIPYRPQGGGVDGDESPSVLSVFCSVHHLYLGRKAECNEVLLKCMFFSVEVHQVICGVTNKQSQD